ncbi:uncharacterized protein LOC135839766 [Planococcus citri]|uniref:uncharacterized protein LOC135839766 n=1 Tax=Planococcus citri TaxID=170843 RepID=UPI0031F745BD
MKISSCSLALLIFVIFSIKNHNAYPFWNLNQTQSSSSTLRSILTYDPITDTTTKSTPQNEIPKYDSFSDEFTTSTPDNETTTYNSFTDFADKSTTSTRFREILRYYPYTDKSTTSIQFKEILRYDPFIDNSTTSTPTREILRYRAFTDESTTSTPYRETSAYDPFTYKSTISTLVGQQSQRNRYNFKHRFRNPVIAITVPVKMSSHRVFKRPIKSAKPVTDFKSDDAYKSLKEYAYIDTPLNSTPMVHLNITLPKMVLEGKAQRLASPYIIRITLARKMAPRSNVTLPSRGFLRIVGSPVNMLQDGNLAMVIGKIANQIGNAYNMSGKDIQGMRHVIVMGPGGQMVNRRATPPKTTTVLTSPIVMTARLRIRPNCTLPKITDQIIYFEDYTKYFELY